MAVEVELSEEDCVQRFWLGRLFLWPGVVRSFSEGVMLSHFECEGSRGGTCSHIGIAFFCLVS